MSGIAAIHDAYGGPIDADLLERMIWSRSLAADAARGGVA